MSKSLDDLSPQEKREMLAKILKEKANKRNSEFPLSYSQKVFWFLYQLIPDNVGYNLIYQAKIHRKTDVQILKKSFSFLSKRHLSLRTKYTTQNSEPVQQFCPDCPLYFHVFDGSKWSSSDINNWLEEEAAHPLDLEKGEVFRVSLLTFAEPTQLPILFLSIHHIAAEYWSYEILLKELEIVYKAFKLNEQPSLTPLTATYKDYVQWERKNLASPESQKHWQYWEEKLSGELPTLNLPTDRPRPPVANYSTRAYSFEIDEQLTSQLRELANSEGVTLYTAFLSALQVLFFRYSGQEDLPIGSPFVTRSRPEFEHLIGCFVNPVVLRGNLSGNPSFKELLLRTRNLILEALEHQDIPFPLLVERIQPVRDPSCSPLFQVSLAWDRPNQNKQLAQRNINEEDLIVESLFVGQRSPDIDMFMSLIILETSKKLEGSWGYNTDLFDETTIKGMVSHFQVLLKGIIDNPEQEIAKLPLLTKAEKHQILVEWNKKPANYTQDECIHQLYEKQADKTPDAVAVVYEQEELTYQELNQKANQLAHFLQTLGVKADSLVGIYVERSLEMVIGLLGILKAGGAYVPIDPNYPSDRIIHIINDAGIDILLTQKSLISNLPETKVQLLLLDSEKPSFCEESVNNLTGRAQPDNLAYVIYTSGSTGKPKGVLVNHANVTRLFAATQDWYKFNAEDVWTLFHSYAFDFSVWELWGGLLYGGRVVIIPYLMSRSPEEFYELLHREQVTVLNQTPSAFRQLIQVEESLKNPKKLALRQVIFGGEALEIQSLKPWFERHGDIHPQLVNMYGITETTVHVTYRPLNKTDLESKASVIGCPIPDLQIYLLDQHQQLVPVGIVGEMYVGGAGLARGYLNRPELTAERFIANPFSDNPEEKLYKTGDLGRYLPNGDLEYLGRIDHQVKIRGFRIELGEIEALLAKHNQVREVIVIPREDQPDNKQLIAYLVPQENPPEVSELRDYLRKELPDYMVPSTFVFLESFSLTPNGKIDRKALPMPNQTRNQKSELVEPRTPTEETLAKIWAEVLGIEKIGIYDNFFDLGGHSLLATQVLSRVRESFSVKISLQNLFKSSTIAEFAVVIENLSIETGQETSTIKKVSRESRRTKRSVIKDKPD